MHFRYLTEESVRRLLDMPTVLQTVEEAFRRLAAGEAENVPRVRAQAPGMTLHSMSAAAAYLGTVGWKNYATTRQGAHFYVGLHGQDGQLYALIEASRLGQLRTGATTGVAAKFLAPPDADELGLFGAGWQAETQLEAVHCVRPLKRALVYCRDEGRRREFAERMSQRLGVDVSPADSPRQAVEGLPMVVTITTSKLPVFEGRWLSPGAFVAAAGSNWATKAEIDVETVRRAERVVCDSVDACRGEAGDLIAARDAGVFDFSQATELAQIVAAGTGRESEEEVCLFKSVGMALEDVAVAHKLIQLHTEEQSP